MLRLMAPLILCNILQQFYNTIDAFVIGRFADQNAFAAVGIASSVMNLFLFAIVGACTGLSVLFSQCWGRKDLPAFRNEHYLTFLFGLGASSLLAAAGLALLWPIETLIHVPASLRGDVSLYLTVVLLALPASYLYNLYSAILRSVSSTGAILGILAACVAVNLLLDLLFVRDFSMGILGAALATALSQCLSATLGFLYLRLRQPSLLFGRKDCRIDHRRLRGTLQIAFVTSFAQAGLYIGKLLVQGVVNDAGTSVIAAYTATTRIEAFANSFGDSGAAATSVLTAQAFGARDEKEVRHYFAASLLLLSVLGILMSLLMFVTAPAASSLLIGSAEGKAYGNAVAYLRVVSVFYTLCFIGNTYAGWFDGVGRVKIPFAGSSSHIAMRIVLSALLVPKMGLVAVAFATGIGWCWVNLFWGLLKVRMSARTRKEVRRRKISPRAIMGVRERSERGQGVERKTNCKVSA